MAFLTDFADQAVVLPLSLVAALVFAFAGWWRGLAAWLLAVGFVFATILALKIIFAACAAVLGVTGIRSPSGHTASACIVYGGILMLLLRGRVPPLVMAAVPAAIAGLFGMSRLALHVHTLGDVMAGGLVGMVGIAAFALLAGPLNGPTQNQAPTRHKAALVFLSVLVMVVLHGTHLHAEAAIRGFAFAGWLPLPAACRSG